MTDQAMLENVAAWISAVPGAPRLTLVSGEADIVVHRAPQSDWAEILGSSEDHESADGVTVATWSADGTMRHAIIVVDDASPQHQRNRTIVHELLHAVGFGHYSCAGGLVYGGGDYNPSWEPTAFDLALVGLVYDERLPAGLDAAELETVLVESSDGPGCPEVAWQSVQVGQSEDSLWCRVGSVVQECSAVDEQRGPILALPVVGWLSEGTLYDHDPRLYTTFNLEGQRVLCRLPADGARAACQRTDGTTVTTSELWTDGESLFLQSQ